MLRREDLPTVGSTIPCWDPGLCKQRKAELNSSMYLMLSALVDPRRAAAYSCYLEFPAMMHSTLEL